MNFRRQAYLVVLLGAGVLGLAGPGCRNNSSSNSGTSSRPGPEESFRGIVQFVSDQIETGTGAIPSGFVMESGGRRSQFIIRNDVTSELIPPAKDGESFRGTITITSKSTYSLRRSEEADRANDGADGGSDQNSEQRSLLDDSDANDIGIDVLDSDLVSSASTAQDADTPVGEPATVVTRQEDEDVRTFDFAYENDRWVLKTEPDADTERAIKRAFERALQLQP